VKVASCQVFSGTIVPRTDEIGLAVRFVNESSEPLRSIVWRAKYAEYTVDFIDDGTFAPSLQIDNYLLTEQGSTHIDLGALASDLIEVYHKIQAANKLEKSSVTLPLYLGGDDPENCSVVRTTTVDGVTWVNPTLVQASLSLAAQMPAPPPHPSPSAAPSGATLPFEIRHCSLSIGGKAYLHVSFRNDASTAADRIVVRAPYRTGAIDFVDQGTYASGIWVDHNVKKALPGADAYFSLDEPAACSVVAVHFTDGSSWQNPATGDAGPLPSPVPNAITLKSKVQWSRSRATPVPTPAPSPATTPAV
jgi:hypothetical protein